MMTVRCAKIWLFCSRVFVIIFFWATAAQAADCDLRFFESVYTNQNFAEPARAYFSALTKAYLPKAIENQRKIGLEVEFALTSPPLSSRNPMIIGDFRQHLHRVAEHVNNLIFLGDADFKDISFKYVDPNKSVFHVERGRLAVTLTSKKFGHIVFECDEGSLEIGFPPLAIGDSRFQTVFEIIEAVYRFGHTGVGSRQTVGVHANVDMSHDHHQAIKALIGHWAEHRFYWMHRFEPTIRREIEYLKPLTIFLNANFKDYAKVLGRGDIQTFYRTLYDVLAHHKAWHEVDIDFRPMYFKWVTQRTGGVYPMLKKSLPRDALEIRIFNTPDYADGLWKTHLIDYIDTALSLVEGAYDNYAAIKPSPR